jgi:putative ABC transport system substrate-binding protein
MSGRFALRSRCLRFVVATEKDRMNRRVALMAVLALGALPLHSLAQQPGKVYRIAFVTSAPAAQIAGPAPASPGLRAFIQGLKARGYIEGQNLILDRRTIQGLDFPGIDDMLTELVRQKPDVIVTPGTNSSVRAMKVAGGIPIVMSGSVDPVGAGLAQSLARPGGSVTGLATDVGAGAQAKRMELLLELLPKARRIAFVGWKMDSDNPWGKEVQSVAAKRRVGLFFAEGKPTGFADALEALKREKSEGFFVAHSPNTTSLGASFGEFTLASRIPSSCGYTEMAEQGCLMSYGQSLADVGTKSATYVDKILKGAKPGDLPIEQPTRFELVINLKTAKAIGIKVPQSLLIRADRVIE